MHADAAAPVNDPSRRCCEDSRGRNKKFEGGRNRPQLRGVTRTIAHSLRTPRGITRQFQRRFNSWREGGGLGIVFSSSYDRGTAHKTKGLLATRVRNLVLSREERGNEENTPAYLGERGHALTTPRDASTKNPKFGELVEATRPCGQKSMRYTALHGRFTAAYDTVSDSLAHDFSNTAATARKNQEKKRRRKKE